MRRPDNPNRSADLGSFSHSAVHDTLNAHSEILIAS
jgi:hypothetical protein